jgi:hypothetical protein
MSAAPRWAGALATLVCGILVQSAFAQVNYEERDGVRYQVSSRTVQRVVPVTEMQDRSQTVYTQQIVTDNISTNQLYMVPVTQYQLRSELRGRFNPFVTPYWTHHLEPVTTWHSQIANVTVPVNRVNWVPQTTTYQVPVTTYRTAEVQETTRVAMSEPRTFASAQPLSSAPVTIAARPSTPLGGVALDNDPPRQATGWQSPSGSYR